MLALLPDLPEASLQRRWNGAAGLELMSQSNGFYARLKEQVARHGRADLTALRVLDFGCGWLAGFVARDVGTGELFGCDPVEEILGVCRQTRVPTTLARSDSAPERVPFRERFDLVFSFSVFTDPSERAHEACLKTIHVALKPGSLLITTVCSTRGTRMTYVEAAISLPYIRERWAPRFELVDINVLTEDPYQVALTLRHGP